MIIQRKRPSNLSFISSRNRLSHPGIDMRLGRWTYCCQAFIRLFGPETFDRVSPKVIIHTTPSVGGHLNSPSYKSSEIFEKQKAMLTFRMSSKVTYSDESTLEHHEQKDSVQALAILAFAL